MLHITYFIILRLLSTSINFSAQLWLSFARHLQSSWSLSSFAWRLETRCFPHCRVLGWSVGSLAWHLQQYAARSTASGLGHHWLITDVDLQSQKYFSATHKHTREQNCINCCNTNHIKSRSAHFQNQCYKTRLRPTARSGPKQTGIKGDIKLYFLATYK